MNSTSFNFSNFNNRNHFLPSSQIKTTVSFARHRPGVLSRHELRRLVWDMVG